MRTTIEHDNGDGTPVVSLTLSLDESSLPQPTGGMDGAVATGRRRDAISEVLINAAHRAALAAFDLDELAALQHATREEASR